MHLPTSEQLWYRSALIKFQQDILQYKRDVILKEVSKVTLTSKSFTVGNYLETEEKEPKGQKEEINKEESKKEQLEENIKLLEKSEQIKIHNIYLSAGHTIDSFMYLE